MTSTGGGNSDALSGHASSGSVEQVYHALQEAFAHSTQTVFYVMAGVMVACYLVAHFGMVGGKMKEVIIDGDEPAAVPDGAAPAPDEAVVAPEEAPAEGS
jgi:hypothetical protein